MAEQRPFDLDLADEFWTTIDTIRNHPESLDAVFANMSKEELVHFYYDFREATSELFLDGDQWVNQFSDGELYPIAAWVVAQGKETYKSVWNDASLAPSPDSIPFCDYAGVAAKICKEKYGRDLIG